MNNLENREQAVADKTFRRNLYFIITIASIVFGCAAAFYSVCARVDVLESKTDSLQDSMQSYQSTIASIDTRLSHIEGALGVVSAKK